MSEKKVTVVVELKAGGDLAEVAKAIKGDLSSLSNIASRVGGGGRGSGGGSQSRRMDAVSLGMTSVAPDARWAGFQIDMARLSKAAVAVENITQSKMIAGMTAAANPSMVARMGGGFGGSVPMLSPMIKALTEVANPSMTARMGQGFLPKSKEMPNFDLAIKDSSENLRKLSVNAALVYGAFGLIVSSIPALSSTFFGSLRVAAGELAIAFTPAVVSLAGILQSTARTIKQLDEVTGGLFGKLLSAVAVPGVILGLGAAVVYAVTWVYRMAQAAMAASEALGVLSLQGGVKGFGAGLLGKGIKGAGIALAGTAAANLVGGMVGGKAGDTISNIGTGASIGAGIGSMFAPIIGTSIGAILGAAGGAIWSFFSSKATPPAVSFDFKNFSDTVEGMDQRIQQEALKDPLQQQQMQQQIQAIQRLTDEIGFLNRVIGQNQAWMVGN